MTMKRIEAFVTVSAMLGLLVLAGCDRPADNGGSSRLSTSAHLAGFLRGVKEKNKPLDLSIRPTKTGLVTTCKGDEPEICDLLAAACQELGGVGQCGGDENPTGCQCET